jgi:alpha-L-rhamnosidase
MFRNAKWIWSQENTRKDDWVLFRQTFVYPDKKPCVLRIAAETRYHMWINKRPVVMEGSLLRNAYEPHSGFVDIVDITRFLRKGQNSLELLVWFWGNGGRNNDPNEHAGVRFECEEIGLFSGASTRCARHEAFGHSLDGDQPSGLYGGYNILYDANREDADNFCFGDAVEYPEELFGTLYERPIPMFRFSGIIRSKWQKCDRDLFRVKLPTALHVLPYLKVQAIGGEHIDIRTDRYVTRGGPGDHSGCYRGQRAEYICRPGRNEFLCPNWVACEEIHFTIPATVRIIALGYRVSEYDTDIMPVLQTGDRDTDILLRKCARTLKFCIRDNFMDCPDRERGQWIGDICVQTPQVFYALDHRAIPLLKKAIRNFIGLRKGDVLVGNVPGIHSGELPSQSLNAISDIGMIREYYNFTGDREVLELAFEPAIRYLMLWEMNEDGLVRKRCGDWYWFDHLNNCDHEVLENCWYYLALKFARFMADTLGIGTYDDMIDARMNSIRSAFDRRYWTEVRYFNCAGYYSSREGLVDERANALAVLAGLAGPDRYIDIKDVLISTFNCSSYMEGYVCEALCIMDYRDLAFKRLMSRYRNLIANENSTLWEDFFILGTKNHAWTGAPLTLFYKYFLGLRSDDFMRTIHLSPDFSILKRYDFAMDIRGGRLDACIRPGRSRLRNRSNAAVCVTEKNVHG